MAYLFDVNNAITANSGAAVLFGLKSHLLTAGWTVPRSGNGTSGGAGDFISAVADLLNVDSWMVVRRPDDGAEWLFSMGGDASTARWDVLYSKEALFVGGDATNRATATDEKFVINDTISLVISGASTFNYVADAAAPYGWACFGWQGATYGGVLVYDPIAAGTGCADDPDPYVCGMAAPYDPYRLTDEGDADNVSVAKGWSGATWGAVPGDVMASSAGNPCFPNGCGGNPYSGGTEDPVVPIRYARNTTQPGTSSWKGFGTMAKWVGVLRAQKSTITQGTTTSIVWGRVDEICLPWPNGVVPT